LLFPSTSLTPPSQPQIKLAISYALAQSTKLSLHERRVTDMVGETKHLPESLARSGKVSLSPETIAKLIGKVFIQKVGSTMRVTRAFVYPCSVLQEYSSRRV
jgi:uncharacterized Rmd1/YagE family protein